MDKQLENLFTILSCSFAFLIICYLVFSNFIYQRKVRRMRKRMAIRLKEYEGLWIAVANENEGTIVSFSDSSEECRKKAQAKGYKKTIVFYVPKK